MPERVADHSITSVEELARLFHRTDVTAPAANSACLREVHLEYLGLSPIVVVGSGASQGLDVSPRGGEAGFIRALDPYTLAMPDFPGNNKIETLRNLVSDERISLLFLYPGLDVTMHVTGRATIVRDPTLLQLLAVQGKQPISAVLIKVLAVAIRPAAGLSDAGIWDPMSYIERTSLPSPGEIINALLFASAKPAGEIEALLERVRSAGLYDEVASKVAAPPPADSDESHK
jgi:predicted pyridoxine 5'-phosphate oxidase superfamily flavin-nucleotide-binding protein